MIVYSELITFPCTNLICYLCIIITNYYHMYLTVKTHFLLCLLLYTDKFSAILNKWNEKSMCWWLERNKSPSIITFAINWNSTWATLTDREQYITCLNKEGTIQECTHKSELEPWWSEHSWSGFVSFDIPLSNFYAFFTCNKCHLVFV